MNKDQYGYPCEPRQIDELSWFYEQREGLVLVNEPIIGAKTTQITIPWRKLEAAVENHRNVKIIRAAKRVPARAIGAHARAASLSPKRRSEIASRAAKTRWGHK